MKLSFWLGKVKSQLATRSTNLGRKTRTTRLLNSRPRLEILEDRTLPSTYVVTTTADSGPGSLRDAITQADTQPQSTITFDLLTSDTGYNSASNTWTIQPGSSTASALPAITNSVTIDATTQPGYAGVPVVVLDGAQAGSSASGLVLTASAAGSTMQGFVIDHFSSNGIEIDGGGNNVIANNYIGVNATGTGAAGNAGDGILTNNSSGNTVGGTAAGAGNVISDNGGDGVGITGSGATGNVVEGNKIGTDVTGTAALGATTGYGFDGGGDGGQVALNIPQLNTNPGATTTVSFWMDWNGSGGEAPVGFSGNDCLEFDNFPGVFGFQTDTNIYGISSAALVNQWHFVTAVIANGAVTQDQLWIDGVEQTLTPIYPSGYMPLGSFNISTMPNIGSGNFPSFAGALDDVAFFNQQLTTAQIQEEYAASLNGSVSATILSQGPVAYYPLNETSGSVAYDASGNGNNGILSASGIVQGVLGGPTGNHGNGVAITGGASGNTVGGTVSGARNVISGNGSNGVEISDAGTSGNVVENNCIGLDVTGTTALANTNDGVLVTNGATGNTIGDTTGGTRNVLSGNRGNGVEISGSGTSGNQVVGDIIGLDVSGSTAVGADGQALGNNGAGVAIDQGATDNTIGGLTSTPGTGAGNVISGNNIQGGPFGYMWSSYGVVMVDSGTSGNVVEGNLIGLDATGTRDVDTNGISLGNSGGVGVEFGTSNNTIGGTTAGVRNVISGNILHAGAGVQLYDCSNNLVAGNFIGTDITGTVALGNGYYGGILVQVANDDTIGGTTPYARNLISGNAGPGINSSSTGIIVEGNYIGTDVTGCIALGGGGIDLGGDDNTIGGSTPGASNIISGTSSFGISLSGTNNLVEGNIIGQGANDNPLPNGATGVFITGSGNTIGGTAAGTGNVISDNRGYGVYLAGYAPYQALYPVTGNVVSGNKIEGNYQGGVRFDGAPADNTIGGTAAGAGNVISANGGPGVIISYSGTTGNMVAGNYIGTDATGTTALGNAGPGVLIENGAASNTVGGAVSGAGNTIAFNTAGVVVQDNGTTADAIRGNAIYDNTAIGIGLGGTTFVANDSQGHAGPNMLQDYPIVQTALINSSGDLVVSYSVPAADASATYPLAIDFYLADATGQGETYLASDTYSATDLANGVKSVDLGSAAALGVAPGDALVVTATDAAGNTSEFSPLTTGAVVPTMADQTITFAALNNQTYGVAPFTVSATASSGLPVGFAILSGPATLAGNTVTVTGAGTVVVEALQTGNGNYNPAPAVDQSFTVAKATLAITANNTTKVFDTANPTFTDTITGFVHNDPATVVSGSASLTTTATTTSPVGTWTITAAQGTLSATNYTFAFVNGTLSITLAPAGDTSVIVLSPSAAAALSLSGNAQLQVSGPVDVDSSSSSAISASGNAEVTAGSIQVVGRVQSSGNAHLSPSPVTGVASFGDPLANLPVPSVSGSKSSVSLSGNSSQTINPGIYSQISVSGNANLTLEPGVYVIAGGGFSVTGNANVSGSGVMIYNAGSNYPNTGGSFGVINLSGNGRISLTPISTGTYAGILAFQSRDNTSAVGLSGNGIVMPGGTIYAPAAPLTITGNGQFKGSLVVGTLSASGNAIAQLSTGNGDIAYTPAQVRTAYGINNLTLDGTGQTIAIVDAYDDPDIYQSVEAFDAQFSLTSSGTTLDQLYGPASSFLTVLNQQGQTSPLPVTDPGGPGTDNWELEEELDVEWAHAIAPGAQIVLVEAYSQSLADLMAAVATAARQPSVSVVSMSWGFPEGQTVLAQDEATYDPYFTTPAGHQGVTFVASTGDYGAAVPMYPAMSANVVAVGGTSLTLNADNSYNSETGWGSYSTTLGVYLGSGGGLSQYEGEPAYQDDVQSTGSRTTPDVSFLADPATGVWIADPYNLGTANPWEVVGGTSLSAPAWAGLIALADQGRVAGGEATLGTAGPTEAQSALYSLSASDYHAVTSGSNGYSAGPGYNLVAGLGTPVANLLVPDLVAYTGGPVSATPVAPLSAADLVQSGNGTSDAAVQAAAAQVFSAMIAPAAENGNSAASLVAVAPPGAAARTTVAVAGRTVSTSAGTGSNPIGDLSLSWFTGVPGATEAVSRPLALFGGISPWAPAGIETLSAPLAPALPAGGWLRAGGPADGDDVLPGDDLWVGGFATHHPIDEVWEALAAGALLPANADLNGDL
jgi:hypothetical protein